MCTNVAHLVAEMPAKVHSYDHTQQGGDMQGLIAVMLCHSSIGAVSL